MNSVDPDEMAHYGKVCIICPAEEIRCVFDDN